MNCNNNTYILTVNEKDKQRGIGRRKIRTQRCKIYCRLENCDGGKAGRRKANHTRRCDDIPLIVLKYLENENDIDEILLPLRTILLVKTQFQHRLFIVATVLYLLKKLSKTSYNNIVDLKKKSID